MTLCGHLFARGAGRAIRMTAALAVLVIVPAIPLSALGQAPAPPGTGVPQPAPAPVPPAGGTIQRIAIAGTQRIEPESVRSYLGLQEGDAYNAAAGDRALTTLFQTGLFSDVRLNWDGAVLTVNVVENPILNQVAYEGNDAIDDDDLNDEVQVRPRQVFTRARVQADVQRILELYRRRGRFGATVEPKVIQRPQNRVDLVFEINEGPTTGIASINFIGNRAFSDGELRSEILTTESAWWRFLTTNDNYDPDRITFDREQLRQFYLARGYADFRVISAVAELTPDRQSFYVTFTVEEGEQYNFGQVEIESQIRDLNPENLRPLLTTLEGETYNASQIDESIEALTYAAGTQGFVFIDIRPRLDRNRETRMVNIVYTIEQGPRVYIERINIVGNTRTRDEVIRREFRLVEGDAFNRVLADRSRTRIRGLGFFREVEIMEEPGSAADRTVLTVSVEEQPTGELSLGAGYSSQDALLLEFSYTERNLFGRGQFMRMSVSQSSIQDQYDFRFTEPYFLGRPLAAGIQIYRVDQDYSEQAGYLAETTSAGFLFGFPISEFGRLSPHYNFQIATITPTVATLLLASGRATSSSFGYTYTYDTRDDPLRPTEGFYAAFSQDLAGLGGDLKYLRTIGTATYYHPVPTFFWDDLVGSATLSLGYISGYGGQDVRLNERFFRGGPTFRGFRIAGIGPRDTAALGQPALGGQFYAIGTYEIRLPQIVPEDYGINLSLFSDFGTLGIVHGVPKTCDAISCIQDELAFRASVGISINWRSPFGPVSFDIGTPIVKQDYDKEQTIRFSAGTNF